MWVEGARQLAIDIAQARRARRRRADPRDDSGALGPDRLGADRSAVRGRFANEPAGFYAAASRKPSGPELIVDAWGEALVAFAWQCVLGVVTGIAAATGKDARGNLLVPVELIADGRGVAIVPMARHRFAGSSTLKPAAARRRK